MVIELLSVSKELTSDKNQDVCVWEGANTNMRASSLWRDFSDKFCVVICS